MFSLAFWKKLNIYAGWAGLSVFFGLTIFAANIEIKDVDLWLHIATGRHIVQTHSIPNHDVLSFTINGHPWIDHEWLFQLVVYFIYGLFGADGLINMQVVAVGLTFVLLLMIVYKEERLGLILFLLNLVLLNYMTRLMLRPDIFSLLYFVLFMYALATQIDRRGLLIILFFLQVLWVNTHGFFIFGPMLVFLIIMGEWCKRHLKLPFEWNNVGRYTDEEYKRLCIAFGVVLLACLVNPYFIEGAIYPIKVLTSLSGESKIFFEQIKELSKPIEWSTLFSMDQYPAYRWMIILSVGSIILNIRRLDVGMFLLWLIFLLFSLSALRNMTIFSVIAFLVILTNLQHLDWKKIFSPDIVKQERLNQIFALILKVVLIFWMVHMGVQLTTRGYFDFDTLQRKSEFGGISLKNYPYKAADFLVAHKITGNFFNDFNSGAYLLGRAHPNIKVFIDGRTEVYGPKYYKDYLKIWRGDAELMEEYVQKYKVTGAFLNSIQKPAPAKLIRHLYQDERWKLVYFDFDAAIFLRDIPENKMWIEQFGLDLSHYVTPKIDLAGIVAKKITPYEHIQRALALYDMELFDQAAEEAEEAYRIAPEDPTILKILGKLSVHRGDYSEALMLFRRALLLGSSDNETRYYLAVNLFHLDYLDEAESQCARILEYSPQNTKVRVLMALIYARQDKIENALNFWPKSDGDLFTIKEIIQEINPDKELLSKLKISL
ncbi:MAG: tetratricopeptide repeat protein [Candidatus Omnitrophica bacterium]|nr:tetratricopeptide repeat protein [Candidatus Omnitrophota bacterium]